MNVDDQDDLGLYYECELFYVQLKKKPKLSTKDIRDLVMQQIKDSKCMICNKGLCECVEDIDESESEKETLKNDSHFKNDSHS